DTLRWTVVQQIDPATPGKNNRKTPGASGNFSNFKSIIVLQKSYECPECGKSFSCSSHFSKHRRTHTG
ncbi:ZN267 protein, partial [Buphagus erythrorhynchus]|nr:ZN267 protein [Buphagus erythrorhynchus]